ncbi:B-cell receptor CD22-like, partial [Micropterus dolomieu]|uniref:B-cell receptor CD22-like n=1 Tax=Micropterus dolomieu TaxID=147949 RepID=UPI001E8DBE12
VTVVQSQNDWGVTSTSTEICALKGSAVDISCTYRNPSRINDGHTIIWFTKERNDQYVDLETDRVQHQCGNNFCTLRIRDLRESDSAEYKFNFNTLTGTFTGSPGVTVSVTGPQLQVHVRRSTVNQFSNWTELTCHSKCRLPDRPSYIWYKNGQNIQENKVYFHAHHPFVPADSYSCAVSGYELFPSPSVYAPKFPSVSVSPSAEIVEGSSVTLTCSSDANPAAKYTWYKENKSPDHECLSEEPQLVFSSIQSSDSGEFYCSAENELGRRTSEHIFINVKYAPKLPSVSVSPSGEIVEGSSVTLTCSSDANPAAKYTWYKENRTLIQGPEGSYYFTSISSKDRGIYFCKSENEYGQINSTSLSIDVQ